MNFAYETERLILKLLEPSAASAEQVLAFYKNNRAAFEQYEGARADDFYTLKHQQLILTNEYNLALLKKCFRFWICQKSNPNHVIGTICFFNIAYSIYDRCETGYKLDCRHWHKGFAKEAMSLGISLMFDELCLHRIEAYVMEENQASIRLLRSLGFQYEGICRQAIRIQNDWKDHMLFARIK